VGCAKKAIIISETDYQLIKCFRTKIPKMIKESILIEPFGICSHRNNFGFELMDKTMTELIQGGILQHFFAYIMEFEFRSLVDEDPGPSVLSLGDLEFGFITWLNACGICVLVFLVEIFWWFGKIKVREYIRLYMLLYMLLKFLQNKVWTY
jgi:hypothetical protein